MLIRDSRPKIKHAIRYNHRVILSLGKNVKLHYNFEF